MQPKTSKSRVKKDYCFRIVFGQERPLREERGFAVHRWPFSSTRISTAEILQIFRFTTCAEILRGWWKQGWRQDLPNRAI